MGEYVPASIQLFGNVSKDVAEELIEALKSYGFALDAEGEMGPSIDNLGQPFHADEVNYGNLERVTDICNKYRVGVREWSGGGYDFDPETVIVYPETGKVTTWLGSHEDEVVIDRGRIRTLGSYEAIIAYIEEYEAELPPLVIEG